jgi:hypothetical protein
LVGMSDEKSRLLAQAERCRRIARALNDAETIERLIRLAEEYEVQAAKL